MWKCSIPKGPKCYFCIIYHQHVKILSIIGITHCYSLIFLLTIINACIEKSVCFVWDFLVISFSRHHVEENSPNSLLSMKIISILTSVLYKNCGEYNLMICYMYVSKSLYEDKLYPAFLTYLRPWVVWLMEQTQIIQQKGKYCLEVQKSFYDSGQ